MRRNWALHVSWLTLSLFCLPFLGLFFWVQRPEFANWVKERFGAKWTHELGLEGDFRGLRLRFLPLGVSVLGPRLQVVDPSKLRLPAATRIEAESLTVSFSYLQLIYRDLYVEELSVEKGKLELGRSQALTAKAGGEGMKWSKLHDLRIRRLSLKDMRFEGNWDQQLGSVTLDVESLFFSQGGSAQSPLAEIQFALRDVQNAHLESLVGHRSLESFTGSLVGNENGVELRAVMLKWLGLEWTLVGRMDGDIFSSKRFPFKGETVLTGHLDQISKIKQTAVPEGLKLLLPMNGQLEVKGQLSGDLRSHPQNWSFETRVFAERLHLGAWHFDKVMTDLDWKGQAKELNIRNTALDFGAPYHGSIKMKTFRFFPEKGFSEPASVVFESVSLHGVLGPFQDAVEVFELDLDGTALVTYQEKRESPSLQVEFDGRGLDLDLHTKTKRSKKPKKHIFQIPAVGIKAKVDWAPSTGVVIPASLIQLPGSKVNLTGGVHPKTGFDLKASGDIQTKDLGAIAEIPIEGQGSLDLRVMGGLKSVMVQVDLKLKDAKYLNMDLGLIQGRVLWDDAHSALRIAGLEGFEHSSLERFRKPQAAYRVYGDLTTPSKEPERLQLRIDLPQTELRFANRVLQFFTKPIEAFPQDIEGIASGVVFVTGGVEESKMQIEAKLKGRNWRAWNEHFTEAEVTGGVYRGDFALKDIALRKRTGLIKGHLLFRKDTSWDWKIEGAQLNLGDFDKVAWLDIPYRGRLAFTSQGTGKEASLLSDTSIRIEDFTVQGKPLPGSHLSLTTKNGSALIQGEILGQKNTLQGKYVFAAKEDGFLKVNLGHFPLAPFLMLLNPKGAREYGLWSHLSGALQLTSKKSALSDATGSVKINAFEISRQGGQLSLSKPLEISYENGNIDLKSGRLSGKWGDLLLQFKKNGKSIQGAVKGSLEMPFLEVFTPALTHAKGTVSLDWGIEGRSDAPLVRGPIVLEKGEFQIGALETPFQNVEGSVSFNYPRMGIDAFESDVGGGRAKLSGDLNLRGWSAPKLDMKLQLKSAKLKIFPFESVRLTGSGEIFGQALPYPVKGSFTADGGLIREPILQRVQKSGATALKAVQYGPTVEALGLTEKSLFDMHIALEARKQVFIQNDLFKGMEIKGAVELRRSLETPQIVGKMVAKEGTITFRNRPFKVVTASADFDNPNSLLPKVEIRSQLEIREKKIDMLVRGPADQLSFEFTSNPPLPPNEILNLILTGVSVTDKNRVNNALQTGTQAQLSQGAELGAALILDATGINEELEKKTGFRFQVASDQRAAVGSSFSAANQRAENQTAQYGLQVTRQVGKRWTFSGRQGLGNNNMEVKAGYALTPDVSFQMNYDSRPINQGNAANVTQTQSYGLDLRFSRSFK